jgi:hypothetical protein
MIEKRRGCGKPILHAQYFHPMNAISGSHRFGVRSYNEEDEKRNSNANLLAVFLRSGDRNDAGATSYRRR